MTRRHFAHVPTIGRIRQCRIIEFRRFYRGRCFLGLLQWLLRLAIHRLHPWWIRRMLNEAFAILVPNEALFHRSNVGHPIRIVWTILFRRVQDVLVLGGRRIRRSHLPRGRIRRCRLVLRRFGTTPTTTRRYCNDKRSRKPRRSFAKHPFHYIAGALRRQCPPVPLAKARRWLTRCSCLHPMRHRWWWVSILSVATAVRKQRGDKRQGLGLRHTLSERAKHRIDVTH